MKKQPNERLRELTSEEISDLSLEMKCCWFYAPWNKSMDGTTIEEWSDKIGAYWANKDSFDFEDMTHEEAVEISTEVVKDLVRFVKKIKYDLIFEVR